MTPDFWLNLAVALGLGLLVGMERERTEAEIAGIRTFPLICVAGFLTAFLADDIGPWLVAAGLLVVAALLVVGNLVLMRRESQPGMTTEVAALVMFVVGALLALDHEEAAIVVGGATAVLLYAKAPMHRFVERIGEDDFRAIVRLVLIGLVIAPVLPDRELGPYGVLNPFRIWLIVVLIEGITLGAYVAYKLFGRKGGTLVAGLLGGLISSTATTVSYAREGKRESAEQGGGAAGAAAAVIALASVVVFARVGVEIAVVAPGFLAAAVPPLAVVALVLAAAAAVVFYTARGELTDPDEREAPSDLRTAIGFGLLYALILLAVAFAKEHLGEGALLGVAAISGLTDIDAITLSTAQLVDSGRLEADLGWRVVMVGALANLVFKGGVVAVLGGRRMLARVALVFGAGLVAGGLVLLFWP